MDYFVSYNFVSGQKNGHGRMTIEVPEEIKNDDDVTEIEDYIREHKRFDNVVLMNFIPLKG